MISELALTSTKRRRSRMYVQIPQNVTLISAIPLSLSGARNACREQGHGAPRRPAPARRLRGERFELCFAQRLRCVDSAGQIAMDGGEDRACLLVGERSQRADDVARTGGEKSARHAH